MAHDELRFDLLDGVHGHTHDDQQRGAAEVEVHSQTMRHPGGHALEYSAHKGRLLRWMPLIIICGMSEITIR